MMHGYGFFGRGGHMHSGFLARTCEMGMGHFNGVWSWLTLAGFVLLIVTAIYFIVKSSKKSPKQQSVHEALKLKFINGEIDEDEYKARKKVLDGK